ncbi:MBL fold metallo-hydrolase [Commensalibacter sp. Nvir]|uniref:MBL fold metallo-hydrolase n=1 Tax=Commensalibacter sp. Nvir TaxID=3069817 RepID=UPI0038D0128C
MGPFFFLKKKRVSPPGIPFSKLLPIDAVLITHTHYDHMDFPLYENYLNGIIQSS